MAILTKKGLGSGSNHFQQVSSKIGTPMVEAVGKVASDRRNCTLAKLAAGEERAATRHPYTAALLRRKQEYDDWLRSKCLCCECGGKALYFMEGKRYCKQHLYIGQAANKKKWTPQAKPTRVAR